jgi:hypothetical protein
MNSHQEEFSEPQESRTAALADLLGKMIDRFPLTSFILAVDDQNMFKNLAGGQ